MRGKTIQVFLTDGSPRGIKLAEITSNIELAIFIPRIKMDEASSRIEVSHAGIYFLFGESEDGLKPVVYIGQSKNCINRIKTHDQKKDFWNYAVIITSKTKSFTPTHIEYLEELAITKAHEANRYKMENGINPKKFNVPETLEADLLDNFDTIKILLSTLGFPVFEEIKKATVKNNEILYCKGKLASAEGDMVDDGFVVFKDSTANREESPSATTWVTGTRKKLIESKILVENGKVLRFAEDHIFGSPSTAAAAILGRQANGWTEWKNKAGKTIDEIYRSNANNK